VGFKLGHKVYYGDAADIELLRTAGAETADVIPICIDDAEIILFHQN
jgi:voltage-gated potassium channel Kch